MPKNHYHAFNITNDFRDVVNGIEEIISSNPHNSIIMGGDMNIHLDKNHAHTRHIVQLAE